MTMGSGVGSKAAFSVTPEICNEAETLASRGLVLEQIAACMGICVSTLYKHKAAEVQLADAIKRGQSKGIKDITNALYERGMAGDTTAIIFYLKNRDADRWLDTKHVTHTDKTAASLTDEELAGYLPRNSSKRTAAAKDSKTQVH